MVQVAATVFLIEGGAALRPDVLAVVARAGLIGIEQDVVVGRRPVLSQRLIADLVRLRRGHQRFQALVERAVHRGDAVGAAAGQCGHFVIGVRAGVVGLRLRAQARAEGAAVVVVLCRGLERHAREQGGHQRQQQQQRDSSFHEVLHFVLSLICILGLFSVSDRTGAVKFNHSTNHQKMESPN